MVSPGNTGLNAVHALSYGTPVGTHNNFNNQMPEAAIIEDKMTGFFFNEDDSEDLSLKIDLWTKEMMAEEMKFFTFQILDALAETYKKSVGDEKIALEIQNFAKHIGQKSNVLKQ